MCGRYTLYTTGELGKRYDIDERELDELRDDLKERYNIAPTQLEPTVVERDGKHHLELMQWGLMPAWAKEKRDIFKYSTFNARSEGIFSKPLWKHAIKHTRCLVPSNGFYEWRNTPTGKQPFFIRPKDMELFSFAGVYSLWKDPASDAEWGTYSIITTSPNKEMEDIHNRMPVILKPDEEERWLEPSDDVPASLEPLMKPYEDGMLEVVPVSRAVNTTRTDNGTLIQPIDSQ